MTTTLFLVGHLAALLALTGSAWLAGELAGVGLLAREPLERGVLSVSLGLAMLSFLGCLLGLLGRLDVKSLTAIVLATCAAGAWARHRAPASRRDELPWKRSRVLAVAVAGLVLLAPLVALALYPPTAFDETLYHLPMARAFARTGGLPFLPDLRFPVMPQLAEVIFAEVLLVFGDVATHLVQLLAVTLTAVLLFVWGQGWERDATPSAAGWIAAGAWLGNPLVVYLCSTGYVEPLLTLFVTAACWSFWKWHRSGQRGWLCLTAVFAASGADTKYLGLVFLVVLALGALAIRPLAQPATQGGRARDLAWFAGVSLAVLAPWYGRILAFTGNPVFPYLSGMFGANPWTPVHFRALVLGRLDGETWLAAAARYGGRLATLPWDVVARRDRVGELPPISPEYLIGAPLLLMLALRDRRVTAVLALAAGFVALFPLLPPDARYLTTVLPLLSLALGLAVATSLRRSNPGRVLPRAILLATILALPGWLYAAYRVARQGPLPAGSAPREAYLARTVPLYPAVAWLNRKVHPEDKVYGLGAEQMKDYVCARFLGDFYGPYSYAVVAQHPEDPDAMHASLRQHDIGYLLVAEPALHFHSFVTAALPGFELLYADDHARLYAVRRDREER